MKEKNNLIRAYTENLEVPGDNPQLTHLYTGAFYFPNINDRTTIGTASLERLDLIIPVRGLIRKLIPDRAYRAMFAQHFRSSALQVENVDLQTDCYEEPLYRQAIKHAWPITQEQVHSIFQSLRKRLEFDLKIPWEIWMNPTI